MALIHSFVQEGMPAIYEGTEQGPSFLMTLLQGCTIQNTGIFFAALYTLWLLIASNIIGYNMYSWLLSYYSVTFLSFAGFITPLFAALFGWFFLGEIIPWQFWVTMGGVFVSLYVFYLDEL
ncbi:MAG TPA: EamA family transporter, partial [Candidatus Bathyarchaeia archaeon]|nr:EamA family transporter [Candidatus Bathyarchaeia archaeon]